MRLSRSGLRKAGYRRGFQSTLAIFNLQVFANAKIYARKNAGNHAQSHAQSEAKNRAQNYAKNYAKNHQAKDIQSPAARVVNVPVGFGLGE